MWPRGQDRNGGAPGDVKTQDAGSSACSLGPRESGTLLPRKFERGRGRDRMNYLTDMKSSDLLIWPPNEKTGCASQFPGVNDPEYIP